MVKLVRRWRLREEGGKRRQGARVAKSVAPKAKKKKKSKEVSGWII